MAVLLLLFISYLQQASAAEDARNILPRPSAEQTLISMEREIFAGARVGKSLFLAAGAKPFLIETPFDSAATQREKIFGLMTASKRLPIKEDVWTRQWVGVAQLEKNLVLLDGREPALLIWNEEKGEERFRTSLVVDKFRPSRDRLGEAPKFERDAGRERFLQVFRKKAGSRLSGITELPAKWLSRKGKALFFISSEIKAFPLFIASCHKEDLAECMLENYCRLDSRAALAPGGAVQVAREGQELWLSRAGGRKIARFKFRDCGQITFLGDVELPKDLPPMHGFHIDADERLWVFLTEPDSKTDASVLFWNKDEYAKILPQR